jgi:hypothetical protein
MFIHRDNNLRFAAVRLIAYDKRQFIFLTNQLIYDKISGHRNDIIIRSESQRKRKGWPMNRLRGAVRQAIILMSNEKQDVCIHCGEVGYQIHYHDGVCHRCWKLGKPGRSEVKRQTPKILRILYILAIGLSAIAAAYLIF